MNTALLVTIAALQVVTTVILIIVVLRSYVDPGPIKHFFESIEKAFAGGGRE